MKQALMMIGIVLTLLTGTLAASANTLTVTPNADGSVMMVADQDVNNVSRIDLTFSYATTFSEPRITLQGGDYSFEQMNRDSKPGLLQLAVIRDGEEMLDANFVLIVDFDNKPVDEACPISFVAADYTYADGKAASPRVIIQTAIIPKKPEPLSDAEKTKQPSADRSTTSADAGSGGSGRSTTTGRPTIPSDADLGGSATVGRTAPEAPPREAQDIKRPDGGENPAIVEFLTCPDILQRFREYRGDGKLSSLLQLFAFDNPCGYRQTPAVAISDGTSKVVLSIETDPASGKSPNFGISGARMLSIRRDAEHVWSIELLPSKGEHEVVLYVVTGKVLKRIPLVVAPPLDFYLTRITPGEKLSPLLEFTIAANYLAGHRETSPPTTGSK